MIELLVVVAIMGVLISLLLPAIRSSMNRARWVQAANNMRQQGAAALQYAAENNGRLPPFHPTQTDPYQAYVGNWHGRSIYDEPVNFGHLLTEGYLPGEDFAVFWSPVFDNMRHYWKQSEGRWVVDSRSGHNPLVRSDFLFNPLRIERVSGNPMYDGLVDPRWQQSSYQVLSILTMYLDTFAVFTNERFPRTSLLFIDGSVRTFDSTEAYRDVQNRHIGWYQGWSRFEELLIKIVEQQRL